MDPHLPILLFGSFGALLFLNFPIAAALGAILIPGMVAAGYDRRSAAALMAAGGGIGIIIPPSIALVIYGVVANASISKLFIAGILFVACGIARISMKEISRAVLPMVVAQTAALLVISFWPDLSLFLTRFMR